jgi:type I restriction enzyme R subunit
MPTAPRWWSLSGGKTLRDLARGIVEALNIDATQDMPPAEADQRLRDATKPFASPALREQLLKMKQKADLVIDVVTQDSLLHAGFSEGSDRATALVQSFEDFIKPSTKTKSPPCKSCTAGPRARRSSLKT